jgi:hypothetical protein
VDHIVDVVEARVLAGYIVELEFEMGETKVIDLEPLLRGPVFCLGSDGGPVVLGRQDGCLRWRTSTSVRSQMSGSIYRS